MKKEERIAYVYLCSQGYTDLKYEPDGNIPPDFALYNKIGIEVRRLNHNILKNSKVEGIEQAEIRLKRGLQGVLEDFSMKRAVKCYWIALQFKRPIGNLNKIKDLVRKELKSFVRNKPNTPYEIDISPNVQITIALAGRKNPKRFRIGLESDIDSGGWTIPLYKENIKYCIKEKTDKIQPFHSKYEKWWLILIDFLHGISNQDISSVLSGIEKSKEWDRIIIVDPVEKRKKFEI